ncbi:MAG: bifunctional serine/threonine-protein kinase/universal stress protein [Burkholderiaceae bacterium]|nr:bifunctional serine/threonine-protein kinase/universal stress protein [Burkholderiaceae bacterium]
MPTTLRPEPGMIIDGFRLEEQLHQGGMALLWRVTRVEDNQDDRNESGAALPLMMKIPFLGDNDDPTAIVGFEVEQMIMPRLSGPHVPLFVAAGDFTSNPYIVMEQIAGNSLRARFDAAPLAANEVVAIGAKIATALHDLHRQQVIHLDLKPSNVMFRENGEAVLIDFGLSRHDKLPDLLAEEFRLPIGTAPYISPEQVLHIRNDPRSDLFALGALLYHLCTGQRAHGNPSSVRGLRRRLYRDPIPPRAHNPQIMPWLQEIILRCLEVDPARRYDSAAQLAFNLNHPEQVALTERALKTRSDRWHWLLKRWFDASSFQPVPHQSAGRQLSKSPIVVVAINLAKGSLALDEALRTTARRILLTEPGARLACVTVQKTNRIGMDVLTDQEGQNLHVKHLVELKHWARPLQLAGDRTTFHVLEAPDPAAAIVDYARSNDVDHIVIGSRGTSMLRRYLGSVSSQVVAQADCSVTVVKSPRAAQERRN